jgi:signal transduction histidine kinase/16S rRNA G966 N2-methylase RsmD
MHDRLPEGALVLDVGTGSGVFAVWATSKKRCRTVAIDVSPRAIRFAGHNARHNGIAARVGSTNDTPLSGEILLLLMGIEGFYERSTHKGPFDVVILNPPFNPTCKVVSPALHAEADVDGQKHFRLQSSLAAGLLREGGLCVGCQMSYDQIGGSLEALEVLHAAFAGRCALRFIHILQGEKQILAKRFLTEQYSSFLNSNVLGSTPKNKEAADLVAKYIASMSSHDEKFSFLYYEVEKLPERQPRLYIEMQTQCRPVRNWDDRIGLHRNIVNHTASRNSIPATAIFLENSTNLVLSPTRAGDEVPVGPNEGEHIWNNSAIYPVDAWLKSLQTVALPEHLFDIALVESAAWYNSETEATNLPEECKVWLSQKLDTPENKLEALKAFQENTLSLQRSRIGPFLHPTFTGLLDTTWRGAIQTTLDHVFNSDNVPQDDRQLYSVISEKLELANKQLKPDLATRLSKIRFTPELGYSSSVIGDLDVERDGKEYLAAMLGRLQEAQCLLPSDLEPGHERHDYWTNRDLELCQLAMHEHLCKLLNRTAAFKKATRWSMLCGIPLTLSLHRRTKAPQRVPRAFRGGIWVLLSSQEGWSLARERVALDLLRFAWLLYNARYNLDAQESILRQREELLKFFSHEDVISELLQLRDGHLHELRRALVSSEIPIAINQADAAYELSCSVVKRFSDLRYLGGEKTTWTPDEDANIELIVQDTIRQLRVLSTGIRFDVTVNPAGLIARVEGSKFRQVLKNLIHNSLKALQGKRDGSVSISASVIEQALQMRIKDNGGGVPAEVLAKLPSASGHGLKIVYQYIKHEAGGSVTVTSKPGEGSEFIVTIPAACQ